MRQEVSAGRRLFWIFFGILLASLQLIWTTRVRTANGSDWLASQFHTTGGDSGLDGIATAFQATAETLRTLNAIGNLNRPLIPSALQLLAGDIYPSREHTAHRVTAAVDYGNSSSSLLPTLYAHQNIDVESEKFPGLDRTALLALASLLAEASGVRQGAKALRLSKTKECQSAV